MSLAFCLRFFFSSGDFFCIALPALRKEPPLLLTLNLSSPLARVTSAPRLAINSRGATGLGSFRAHTRNTTRRRGRCDHTPAAILAARSGNQMLCALFQRATLQCGGERKRNYR